MHFSVLLSLTTGFLLGVGLRTVYELPFEFVLWLLLLAVGVGLVWRRKSGAFSTPILLSTCIFITFLAVGVVRTNVASWQFGVSPLEQQLGRNIEVSGKIIREPDLREKTVHLYIETGQDLVLVSTDRLNKFSYGDQVTVSGKLERPESFETDLGRIFNYPGYLQAKGVEYRIAFAEVTVTDTNLGNPIISVLLFAKERFIASFEQIIPEPSAGLGSGLLLGVKSALGEEVEKDFRRTGIVHIVVLSGYNVMLVVAFILFCFSFFLSLRSRVVAGIIAVAAFALIVGLSATVVRASFMASLVLLAQLTGRRYDVLRALLLAGLVMVFINPYILVYDIGFQLSFMATLGLVLIVPQFEATVMGKASGIQWREFLLATISTQIAVLPLLMYHIGEVSLIAVVVNMLVLPIVPLAMFLTFLTGLVGFLSVSLASLIGWAATFSLNYILYIADWFARLPFATMSVPQFSLLGVTLIYLGMFVVWYLIKFRKSDQSEMSDWTIETEEAAVSLVSSTRETAAHDSETPIFFR